MVLFPTTILCIDDQQNFINALAVSFANHKHPFHFEYTRQTSKALAYIKAHATHPLEYLRAKLNEKLDGDIVGWGNGPFFKCIRDFVSNKDRYSALSAVVSDYHMPGVEGITLLNHVPNNIYKVMFTAVMKDSHGIDAFNKKQIHRFIRKETETAAEDLIKVFPDIQSHFDALSSMPRLEDGFFENADHVARAVARTHDFVEMYVIAMDFPIYLMIDAQGCDKIVHLFTPQTTAWYLLEHEKESLEPGLLERVRSGEMAFCSFDFDAQRQPIDNWAANVHPVMPVKGSHVEKYLDSKIKVPLGISYHIMDIGKNVYSKGSFQAKKPSIDLL